MNDPVYLTTEELAQRWKCSTNTLSNWRVKRIGPPWKKLGAGRNNKVLYKMEDVLNYEELRNQAGFEDAASN
jgi:hypothetical protein